MKEIGAFKTSKYFKQKQASYFCMRAVYLANLFGNYFGTNVNELQKPENDDFQCLFHIFRKILEMCGNRWCKMF